MLIGFAGMHYFMIFKNTGTLESVIPIFKKQRNRYNLGAKQNFIQVFGNDPLYWFLPVFTSLGDGCSFPTNETFTSEESSPNEEDIIGNYIYIYYSFYIY